MTFLVERLAELRRHLDHLDTLAPRIPDRVSLERDLSLHNDVMFSLLMVAQLVIDIAGELSARRGERFEDYTGAIRNLTRDPRFPADLAAALEPLPGFRNIVIHEYRPSIWIAWSWPPYPSGVPSRAGVNEAAAGNAGTPTCLTRPATGGGAAAP
jgi:uncharacterized protein YutE (UPF0331/DUF86 family)